jgi:hypothetical protein
MSRELPRIYQRMIEDELARVDAARDADTNGQQKGRTEKTVRP